MIEDKVSKKELERIRKDIASEGKEIDYKEVFKFTNRKDKLELIKDIVAIANTRGGYIVYGVKEERDGKFGFIKATIDFALDREDLHDQVSEYICSLVKNHT